MYLNITYTILFIGEWSEGGGGLFGNSVAEVNILSHLMRYMCKTRKRAWIQGTIAMPKLNTSTTDRGHEWKCQLSRVGGK